MTKEGKRMAEGEISIFSHKYGYLVLLQSKTKQKAYKWRFLLYMRFTETCGTRTAKMGTQ
jgi:hypothetical protein